MIVGTAFTWVLMPSLLRLGEARSARVIEPRDAALPGEPA
jgi:hypothetical protein